MALELLAAYTLPSLVSFCSVPSIVVSGDEYTHNTTLSQ